ncbi:MAG: antibiotic biosynthesis monooxygenase family protein [Desulfobaccales bacterium]
MSPVILINPFEVPKGKHVECLIFWDKAAEYLRRQPGFISARLHRALSPETKFHFINVAEWESAEHFHAAVDSQEFQQLIEPYREVCPHYPGLYEIIRA